LTRGKYHHKDSQKRTETEKQGAKKKEAIFKGGGIHGEKRTRVPLTEPFRTRGKNNIPRRWEKKKFGNDRIVQLKGRKTAHSRGKIMGQRTSNFTATSQSRKMMKRPREEQSQGCHFKVKTTGLENRKNVHRSERP